MPAMNERYLSRASRCQALCSASGSSGCASSCSTFVDSARRSITTINADAGQQDDDRGRPSARAGRTARAICANRPPTTAPIELPAPMIGNRRLPCSSRVDVRGERPELRDDRVAEHADPQEERQADRHVVLRQHREDDEVRDEEQEDDREQLHPPDPARELAVDMHDARPSAPPGRRARTASPPRRPASRMSGSRTVLSR